MVLPSLIYAFQKILDTIIRKGGCFSDTPPTLLLSYRRKIMSKRIFGIAVVFSLAVIITGCSSNIPTSPLTSPENSSVQSTPPSEATDFVQNLAVAPASTTVTVQCTFEFYQSTNASVTIWYLENNRWQSQIVTSTSWKKTVANQYGYYFAAMPNAAGTSYKSLVLYKNGSAQCYAGASGTCSDIRLQGIFY
jgi:hypothetical protein